MNSRMVSMVRRPLAAAVFAALLAPGAALAETKKEKELEARVAQLEAQVQQLLSAQQQTQAQVSQTQDQVAQTRTQVGDTQAQLDQVKASASKAVEAKPQFTTAPGISVAFHGFINATAFGESRPFNFGNGQNAEWPTPGSSGRLSGVDIRNTRFWFDITGARMGEHWTGGGRLELDFFGGNNGTGAYAGQQPIPRLRQAYMDLDDAATGTKIRIGQQWTLMFPLDNIPDSLAHVAFPLGFGTGIVGWRYPGIVLMQDLNHGGDGAQWRLDVGAFSGNWASRSTTDSTTNYLTDGNAGFRPQVEARLRVAGGNWIAYATGHYSEIDLSGVDGTGSTTLKSEIKSTAFGLGAIVKPGPWNLKAYVFTGNGMGQNFGALSQFGDISEVGGYAQLGYSFNKYWSLNAFYGIDRPDKDDVLAWSGTLLRNQQTALNLIYANGPYKFGLEALHDKLERTTDGGATTDTVSGNQVSVSAQYTF
ncbi:MAG: hypothetical protein QM601_12840 [Pseudoxanthomonas sp.]